MIIAKFETISDFNLFNAEQVPDPIQVVNAATGQVTALQITQFAAPVSNELDPLNEAIVADLPDEFESGGDTFTVISRFVAESEGFFRSLDSISVDDLKHFLTRRVNAYRDAWIEQNFVFGGLEFDSDERAQKNFTGAVTRNTVKLAENLERALNSQPTLPITDINWIIADDRVVPLTFMEVLQIGDAFASFISDSFLAANQHKTAIRDLTTKEDILDYYEMHPNYLWPSNDLGGTITGTPV